MNRSADRSWRSWPRKRPTNHDHPDMRRAASSVMNHSRSTRIFADELSKDSIGLAPQPDHHVDAGDFIAFGWSRRSPDEYVGIRNVEERILLLDEEMVMLRRVG